MLSPSPPPYPRPLACTDPCARAGKFPFTASTAQGQHLDRLHDSETRTCSSSRHSFTLGIFMPPVLTCPMQAMGEFPSGNCPDMLVPRPLVSQDLLETHWRMMLVGLGGLICIMTAPHGLFRVVRGSEQPWLDREFREGKDGKPCWKSWDYRVSERASHSSLDPGGKAPAVPVCPLDVLAAPPKGSIKNEISG